MMDSELTKWLEEISSTLSREGVEPYRRPWEALRRLSLARATPIDVSSPLAKSVFDWFQQRSRPGTHQIGALYTSLYYYDSSFWKMEIPLGYGRFVLQPQASLKGMPQLLKDRLLVDQNAGFDFTVWWADCVDYAFGISEVARPDKDKFGLSLLYAADQEMRSAVIVLLEPRTNARAILMLRMAVEMFLKSIIALKVGLNDAQAKEIGHDLYKGFDRFIALTGYDAWRPAKDILDIFPPVSERYQRQHVDAATLWKAMGLAQSLGTVVVREHTDRNTLAAILAQLKPSSRGAAP